MARPKIPAARKPRKLIKTLNEETEKTTEEVPFGINLIAKHLSDITTKLGLLVDALAFSSPGTPTVDPDANRRIEEMKSYGDRIARLEGFPAGIEGRIAALEAKTCSCPEMAPTLDGNGQPVIAPKRHRRTKAEMEAARAAEAAQAATPAETAAGAQAARAAIQPAPAAPKPADRATCTHPQIAVVPTNPKLSRCLMCGAVIETPASMQTVPAVATPPPAAPAPAPATSAPPAAQPTLDDVRGAAISWIGKHGKEKFTALLAEKYGAAQISAIPQAQWASLIASLSNGG